MIAETGVNHIYAHAGYEFDLGDGIELQILNPPKHLIKDTSDDVDNNGMVLRLDWRNVSFLFAADIHSDGERCLIANRARLNSTVLKVAHHGSRTSTLDGFLDIITPEVAVISAGKDNRFGHPHSEVLDRLQNRMGEDNIFITSEDGTVEFITDGDRLWVKKDL
jgi:competence protein ComEC